MALKPEIRLDVYSHNVKVTRFTIRGKESLLSYCRNLAEYGLKMVGYKKFVREMLRVYASATKDRTEFRFHRNNLEELIGHLKEWGYREEQMEIVYHDIYVPKPATFTMDSSFKPRDYQKEPIDYLVAKDSSNKILVVQTGKGKAQPLSAKIKVPGGWKLMGDIKVGDTVTAWNGEDTSVVGVFPQGEETVYEITLCNGARTECSDSHLWGIFDKLSVNNNQMEVLTTRELRERRVSNRHDPHVPVRVENSEGEFDLVRIENIRKVGTKQTQCISIDHPDSLYVTDDFIVTHNTKMTLSAISKISERVALVIKGMYVEKWIDDVKESFGCKPGELMVVRGSKDLRAIIDLAQAGELEASFIIITNKTLYNYLKHYERTKNKDKLYGCNPEVLFETLGVGIRAIDEVHQDFHLNFRLDLYTHVPKTISLSATMISDDAFMNRMYETMFPMDIRFKGIAYDKYIAVKALFYRASNIRQIRFMGKRRNYSHVVFEQSLMKNRKLLQKYLDMIAEIVNVGYISKREPGQKMLVFCATVDMCTLVSKHLQELHSKLDVRRYVSDDEYEDLLTADISVSTIKSAGTAVDVPDLRVCLLTDALSSRQANEQTVGRLRRLKRWPDTTPEFLYLVCEDIPQHVRYHNHKEEFLADKVLSQKIYNLGTRL